MNEKATEPVNSGRRTTSDERRHAKARLVAVALSLLALSLQMRPGEARAQETEPSPPASAPSAPPEAGGQETGPSTPESAPSAPPEAGSQEAGTSPPPPSAPPSPPSAPASPLPKESLLADATGLVLQPPYLILRVPVALVGGLAGGILWAGSGGLDEQGAQRIWEATVFRNWGWPEFVRTISGPSSPSP